MPENLLKNHDTPSKLWTAVSEFLDEYEAALAAALDNGAEGESDVEDVASGMASSSTSSSASSSSSSSSAAAGRAGSLRRESTPAQSHSFTPHLA